VSFPKFHYNDLLPTCYELVSDTANYLDMTIIIMMAIADVKAGGPMAQVRGLGPRVGGRLALFCIHAMNRLYGALVVTSWTCYGAL